jgi:hypothetical protein
MLTEPLLTSRATHALAHATRTLPTVDVTAQRRWQGKASQGTKEAGKGARRGKILLHVPLPPLLLGSLVRCGVPQKNARMPVALGRLPHAVHRKCVFVVCACAFA